ncbi:hypothetical protein, partial [Aeromonas caviae]|uniref:hypothetical protein n=1 Tax=Aeromonas caviae TaxID=648 RepID=UPI001CC7F0E5
GLGVAGARFDLAHKVDIVPAVVAVAVAPEPAPVLLPAQGLAAREHGRDYLKGRGISPDTIEHAEKAGMVRYA